MNKAFAFLCVLIGFILFTAVGCFAGDIPEALLSIDSAQVYIGRVKDVNENSITMIQEKNIKGDFIQGAEITYTMPNNQKAFYVNGSDFIEVDGKYLCGYADKNNPIRLWVVDDPEAEILTIKSQDDMSKRMQEYLNNGSFAQKEQERLSKIKSSGGPTELSQEAAEAGESDINSTKNFMIVFIAVVIFGIVIPMRRIRR